MFCLSGHFKRTHRRVRAGIVSMHMSMCSILNFRLTYIPLAPLAAACTQRTKPKRIPGPSGKRGPRLSQKWAFLAAHKQKDLPPKSRCWRIFLMGAILHSRCMVVGGILMGMRLHSHSPIPLAYKWSGLTSRPKQIGLEKPLTKRQDQQGFLF